MKGTIRTILLCAAFGIAFVSCEPRLWDNILAAPGPVDNLVVTHTSGFDNNIQFDYDIPASSANEFQLDENFIKIWIYSRLSSGGDEVYCGGSNSVVGTGQGFSLTITTLTPTVLYDFIVYTVDREFQRSEPVVEPSVEW